MTSQSYQWSGKSIGGPGGSAVTLLQFLLLTALIALNQGCATAEAVASSEPGSAESRRVAELKQLFPLPQSGSDTESADEQAASMLFWTPRQRDLGFQSIDLLLPTRTLPASSTPYELRAEPDQRIDSLHYEVAGQRYSVEDFMRDQNMGGLLVLQGNEVRYEKYGLDNNAQSLWVSFSVAKSVTSLLIGAAVRDGYIKSLDDPITAYLPRMKGSAYDQASIRNLLQMASGVAWNEDYEDPQSDVSYAGGIDGLELETYLAKLPRKHAPGEVFNYSTGETNLAGALLRAAIGNNLASYATHKIWQGFGMASDANWLLNAPDGTELGGCCISATLRDYARIGRFVLAEQAGRGADSVLPEGWIQDSIKPSKGFAGYGYFWWLIDDRMFAALGIFGQSIYVDPDNDLVIVTHGSTAKAVAEDFTVQRAALVNAIRALY